MKQLGADPRPALQTVFRQALEGEPSLFPAGLTRAAVERDLRHWSQPPHCPLTLENAGDWLQRADDALARCQSALHAALLDKASLLHSDALRERLAQGGGEPFLAGLLATQTVDEMADYLERKLVSAEKSGFSKLLSRYLKKIQVRKLRLADFAPSKRTLERADVEGVVGEFRAYLNSALDAGEGELPVIELE